jgi:Na+-transporting methylmalonyl-CoA/oxaloacetate decarboxylase gamma subunit|tara:strand:- start:3055 stop:3279 length:225 start_codon:yes stop_codon:yes gene_type:complete
MNDFSTINEGVSLMLTGMFTVFMFLCLLIVVINISSIFFNQVSTDEGKADLNLINKPPSDHKKIINHIKKRISE